MRTQADVALMLRLKGLGWGLKRIAGELGYSRKTVRSWLAQGEWRPYASPSRPKSSTVYRTGCASVFVSMPATRTWCARNWSETKI